MCECSYVRWFYNLAPGEMSVIQEKLLNKKNNKKKNIIVVVVAGIVSCHCYHQRCTAPRRMHAAPTV